MDGRDCDACMCSLHMVEMLPRGMEMVHIVHAGLKSIFKAYMGLEGIYMVEKSPNSGDGAQSVCAC